MTANKSGTPAWVWIGTGCLVAIVLVAVVVGGLVYYGFRKTREMEQTMRDPAARTDAALEILGAEVLPDGYHAVAAFSVPLLMETVILSDQEVEDPTDRGGTMRRHRSLLLTLTVCLLIGAPTAHAQSKKTSKEAEKSGDASVSSTLTWTSVSTAVRSSTARL